MKRNGTLVIRSDSGEILIRRLAKLTRGSKIRRDSDVRNVKRISQGSDSLRLSTLRAYRWSVCLVYAHFTN